MVVARLAGGTIDAAARATATVTLDAVTFAPASVTVARGSSVALVDAPDGAAHLVTYGRWVEGLPMPAAYPAAPPLDTPIHDGAATTAGEFHAPGSYLVYCVLHPGMNLEITAS